MLNLLLIVYAKLLLIVKKNLPTRRRAPCGTVPAGINGGCVNMAAVVQMTGKIAIIRIEYWWRKGLCLRSDKTAQTPNRRGPHPSRMRMPHQWTLCMTQSYAL